MYYVLNYYVSLEIEKQNQILNHIIHTIFTSIKQAASNSTTPSPHINKKSQLFWYS